MSTGFHRIAACGILLGSAATAFASPTAFESKHYDAGSSYDASQLVDAQIDNTPYPFDFPVLQNGSAVVSGQFPMEKCHDFTLEEASILDIQHELESGRLSSVDLVLCYMQRNFQTDSYIKSIIQLNPDVLTIASALDAERHTGKTRGPLHGIPFLVKDNIASKDKMETTAGSLALLGSVVPRDAHVVSRLRAAGAILMGHAGLSEWADMRSNSYSEGYSARGGQARSPYNLTQNPGGSSSGSAAAVAANAIPFALGTETDGSVINPAERNGLVGIKPTVGLTSRDGVIPESHNQDTVGCLAKTLHDATLCLDVIYGIDARDNYTSAQVTPPGGYTPFLSNPTLAGARFGLPWDSFWKYADSDQISQLTTLLTLLESAGATIINGTELPNRDTIISPDGWDWDYGTTRGYTNESEYTVVKVDFYNDIAKYLSQLNNTNMRSLEDLVAFNTINDGSEGGTAGVHPAFASGQDGFIASLESGGVMNETYWQAYNFVRASTREQGIDAALANEVGAGDGGKVDSLLVPPDVGQTYQIAAQAGYPMITVSGGVNTVGGMPFGLALMGTAWSEATLVRLAAGIEDVKAKAGIQRPRPKWLSWQEPIIPVVY